jgi:mono/diheme cytochrome c family protein
MTTRKDRLHGILLALFLLPLWGSTARASEPAEGVKQDDKLSAGRAAFVSNCGFCHGTNALGTGAGPDLSGSSLLKAPAGLNNSLAQFLKTGRPAKGMPAFASLDSEQVSAIGLFLEQQIHATRTPQLSILVGNAPRGSGYFDLHCRSCHVGGRDLAGIGARYDEKTLQARIVNPRARGTTQAPPPKNVAIAVDVQSKEGTKTQGELIAITDFFVTLRETSGARRTFQREGDEPRVTVHDPLKAHWDLVKQYRDEDLHDLTAYLATMK